MRAILTIACASVAFAAGAQAQDALKSCRQIKDDGERLKCYDRLDASSSSRTGLGMQDHIKPCTCALELDQAKGAQELEY